MTRKFPPATGGMEQLSADVYQSLLTLSCSARLISLGRRQWHLFWWLPVTALRVAALTARREVDEVLTGDGLTYIALRLASHAWRTPMSTIACGLDLTWPRKSYQLLLRRLLPQARRVIAISEATAAEARARGVTSSQLVVVRPGITAPDVSQLRRDAARRRLLSTLQVPVDAVLILTVGRLVRRKGVRWFVANVLGKLPSNCIYLIAGEGPEEAAICEAARVAGLRSRVHVLGRVTQEQRELLLMGADLFVQPNIAVPGDIEGFGLAVLEAAMRGTPVVAAALEGILDAVIDGETGILVESGNPDAYVRTIESLLGNPGALRSAGDQFQARAATLYSMSRMRQDLGLALDMKGNEQ